jgi:EAL domain-containing protein (putative c-di-GMP-specific phosphodiesterase class I)
VGVPPGRALGAALAHPRERRFQVSINQSPLEFQRDGKSYARWLSHLDSLGLQGQAMVVEITEGLLLDASTAVTDRLQALREAGIQVALDDFGTGYSSLSYLKKFNIDYLKIDQSFTRNLAPGSPDMALSEAIIVMAHKLGLKVIAEGVETAQQLHLLREAGCDHAQGYLFSRPIPVQDFDALLLSGQVLPVTEAA